MAGFDYNLDFKSLDFRQNPELYRVGKGEQGVLLVEPYKSELLPLWRFATPAAAKKSSRAIFRMFNKYLREVDFAGMDMARKFLQMGFTRARRYANHKSGQKYWGVVPDDKKGQSGSHDRPVLPVSVDPIKAAAAQIFKQTWDQAEANERHRRMKMEWKLWYG